MMYSLNLTSLVLKSYKIEEFDQQHQKGSFILHNPGPDDDYELDTILLQDDGHWHSCDSSGNDSLPWQLLSCEYLFNQEGNKIDFRLRWYCDDRDPFHP